MDVMDRTNQEFDKIMRNSQIETSGDDVFDEEIAGAWKQYRVHERDFGDVYDQGDITHDLTTTRGIKNQFEGKQTNEAYGLHIAFMEGVNKYNWFGNSAEVIYTSEFDDIRRGVDCVVCFPQEGRPSIKIGVDITSSDDLDVLRTKIKNQLTSIREYRNLPEIKYFQYEETNPQTPEETEPKGKIRLPVVTLGADINHAREIINDFSTLIQSAGSDRKSLNNKIEKSPIAYGLLKECIAQLALQLDDAVLDYAIKEPKECPEGINNIIAWLEDWEELPMPGEIPEDMQIEFEEMLTHPDITILKSRTDKTIKQLVETLAHIFSIQKEKGDNISADALHDYTLDYLSKPTSAYVS